MERYSRQILCEKIGKNGQRRLKNSKVVIIGCGALGTVIAESLVRAGVGNMRIVDRDMVELNNLQRQVLFDENDAKRGVPKAIAAVEKLKKINSSITLESKVCDANPGNIENLVRGADIVLDGLDNMETRFLINEACVKNDIPWIYGAAIGTVGCYMTIIPGRTACLRCVVPKLPSPGTLSTCDTVGVLNTVTHIVASFQTTEVMKLLLHDEEISSNLIFVNSWEPDLDKMEAERDDNCPVCGRREFRMLEAKEATSARVLCGRNAVQISPAKTAGLSLEGLQASLNKLGEVSFKGYLLSFRKGPYEMIIFPDARVIIKGTRDESVAKSLYAMYIGL